MNERRLLRARPRRPRPLRIFISYRRGDSAAYAGRLYDALAERFGAGNLFMDIDTIELGTDFSAAIDRALESCDVAIALIGRGWVGAADAEGRRRLDDPDDVLRLELERALAQGLVVIPAAVQGVALPAEEDLPAPLAPLARRQGIELRDTAWRDDVARLVRRLERVADESAHAAAAERRAPGAPRSRRRLVLVAVALAAALAAAAAAVAIATRDGEGAGGASGAERRLLDAVPAAVRSDCTRIDWGPGSALAGVSCPGAGVAAEYYLFASGTVLDGWFVLAREDAGVPPDSGSCTGSLFRGEGVYSVDGSVAGRRFCFLDEDEPNLVWTDEQARVGAVANVWDGTGEEAAESLLRQWLCCLRPQR